MDFKVLQFVRPVNDFINKRISNTLFYNLNLLYLSSLNGIATLSIMIIAGSDYADACVSQYSRIFDGFLQKMVLFSRTTCICMENIEPEVNERDCNKCGYIVQRNINRNTYILLREMSKYKVGNMPLFELDKWQNINDVRKLWAIPFVSVALVTTCIYSSNIHKYLRSKKGSYYRNQIPINKEYMYIWFELLYTIFNYICCSSNYLKLLQTKCPKAHVRNIPTKELLYHTLVYLETISVK